MIELNFYKFPDKDFGGDFKDSLVYKSYQKGMTGFFADVKSAIITVFNPKDKFVKSIKVVNTYEELDMLLYFMFEFVAIDDPCTLKAQCNHTFVFQLVGDTYAYVQFSTSNVLAEKPFNLISL